MPLPPIEERMYPFVDDKGHRFTTNYDGRWYSEQPITHTDASGAWDECPLCGEQVDFTATHDNGMYGAVPDRADCTNCIYRWSE